MLIIIKKNVKWLLGSIVILLLNKIANDKKKIIICISRLSEINLKSKEYGTKSTNQRKLNLELKEKIRN